MIPGILLKGYHGHGLGFVTYAAFSAVRSCTVPPPIIRISRIVGLLSSSSNVPQAVIGVLLKIALLDGSQIITARAAVGLQ